MTSIQAAVRSSGRSQRQTATNVWLNVRNVVIFLPVDLWCGQAGGRAVEVDVLANERSDQRGLRLHLNVTKAGADHACGPADVNVTEVVVRVLLFALALLIAHAAERLAVEEVEVAVCAATIVGLRQAGGVFHIFLNQQKDLFRGCGQVPAFERHFSIAEVVVRVEQASHRKQETAGWKDTHPMSAPLLEPSVAGGVCATKPGDFCLYSCIASVGSSEVDIAAEQCGVVLGDAECQELRAEHLEVGGPCVNKTTTSSIMHIVSPTTYRGGG